MSVTILVLAAVALVAALAVLVVQRARRLPGAGAIPDYWPYCLDDFGPLQATTDGSLRCDMCGRTYSAARLEAVGGSGRLAVPGVRADASSQLGERGLAR